MLIANNRLYDQIFRLIENGDAAGSITLLIGHLAGANLEPTVMGVSRETLHNHDLHRLLLENSHTHRASTRLRGYAGDAELIDYYYDKFVPPRTSLRGRNVCGFLWLPDGAGSSRPLRVCDGPAGTGLGIRKRECLLAWGYFREANALIGRDLGNVDNVVADFVIGASLPSSPVLRPRS